MILFQPAFGGSPFRQIRNILQCRNPRLRPTRLKVSVWPLPDKSISILRLSVAVLVRARLKTQPPSSITVVADNRTFAKYLAMNFNATCNGIVHRFLLFPTAFVFGRFFSIAVFLGTNAARAASVN